MIKETDSFYISKQEPHKSCLLALRSIILRQDPDITETIKYGMPCFCYKKKMFCYLWTDKKTGEPYLLMVEGKHLDHPSLVSGDRARMKVLHIIASEDLPISAIESVLHRALELYRRGVIKIEG